MDFLTYSIGEWAWQSYVARFVYKNLYFFGLQTVVVMLVIMMLVFILVFMNMTMIVMGMGCVGLAAE